MMLWYCARLTPSRNTALGSGSFCNAAFFSLKNIQYLNAASPTISVTGKVRKAAKIRNQYNQVPHLTQDTNGQLTNSQLHVDITNES